MNAGGILFSNTAAFWGLLAVPGLVAVHFFQQRSRRVVLSTRFLVDSLAPESAGGRTWERWRGSRAFWAQVAAVLLLVWVLAEPRWARADSTQTVVIVLDDAVAMQAVADEARAAARGLMAEAAAGAVRTEWVVMGSDPRAPVRYRGAERARAEAAVGAWRPTLGTHDYGAALQAGRALAVAGGAGTGVCWFVTDREGKVPADQAAVGVGRVVANAGFAGGAVERGRTEETRTERTKSLTTEGTENTERGEGSEWRWRAVVKNHAGEAQRRSWWIETGGAGGAASERRTVEVAAGAVVELGGVWPAGAERAVLRLEGDGFGADDALPLVRPEAKRLEARVNVGGETGAFFRRVLGGVEGVEVGAKVGAKLVVETLRVGGAGGVGAGVEVGSAGAKEERLVSAPVVAERHALVEGLNWQGFLGTGAGGAGMGAGDEALLWQADKPLAWLRAGAEGRRRLVLNFDWAAGNAGRLPATVLLLRRYAEGVRDAQAGSYAGNFDAGAAVALAEADRVEQGAGSGERGVEAEWSVAVEGGERRVVGEAELAVLRAPAEAGFFAVRRGDETLVRGAAQFADARQGDFRGAGVFRREPAAGEAAAARARNTQGDPFAAGWLALAGAALVVGWWPSGRGRTSEGWPRETRKGAKDKTGTGLENMGMGVGS